MGSISVSSDFSDFYSNLRMSDYIVTNIRNRYHAITRRINSDFWNSSSDITHSLYVGSYGRGTCIYTSDIDIIVELPWIEYTRYDNYKGPPGMELFGSDYVPGGSQWLRTAWKFF